MPRAKTRDAALRGIDRTALRELKYENRGRGEERSWSRNAAAAVSCYHHIKMMVQGEVGRLKTALETDGADAEGLVLDERDGVGGPRAQADLRAARLDGARAASMRCRPCHTRKPERKRRRRDVYGKRVPGADGRRGSPGTGRSSWFRTRFSRSDKEILPFTFPLPRDRLPGGDADGGGA